MHDTTGRDLSMSDHHHLIVGILVKYALHQPLNEAEQEAFAAWQAEDGANRIIADRFGDPEWVADHRRELHQAPTGEIWAAIRRHTGDGAEEPVPVVERTRRPRISRFAGLMSAAVLWAVVAGIWVLYSGRPAHALPVYDLVKGKVAAAYRTTLSVEDGRTLVLDTVPTRGVLTGAGWRLQKTDSNCITYEVAAGKARHRLVVSRGVLEVRFADHSTIWVNKATRLGYPIGLRGGVLTLEGEAFFDIFHDVRRPVDIVTARGDDIKLLGTKVNVRSYADGQRRVTVFTDSVRVESGQGEVVVRPHFEAVLSGDHPPVTNRLNALAGEPEWIGKRVYPPSLVFTEAPVKEAIWAMADRYGLVLVGADKITGKPVTGELRTDQPLRTNLKGIQGLVGNSIQLLLRADTLFIRRVQQ